MKYFQLILVFLTVSTHAFAQQPSELDQLRQDIALIARHFRPQSDAATLTNVFSLAKSAQQRLIILRTTPQNTATNKKVEKLWNELESALGAASHPTSELLSRKDLTINQILNSQVAARQMTLAQFHQHSFAKYPALQGTLQLKLNFSKAGYIEDIGLESADDGVDSLVAAARATMLTLRLNPTDNPLMTTYRLNFHVQNSDSISSLTPTPAQSMTAANSSQALSDQSQLLWEIPPGLSAEQLIMVQAALNQSASLSVDDLENLIKSNPPLKTREEDLLYRLAQQNALGGEITVSEQALERLTTKYPQGRFSKEAHLRLGELAFSRAEFATALAHYQNALGWQYDADLLALYKAAWSQYRLGNLHEAQETFGETIRKAKKNKQAQQAVIEDSLRAVAIIAAIYCLNGGESMPDLITIKTSKRYQGSKEKAMQYLEDSDREYDETEKKCLLEGWSTDR